ncbi:MAG: phosphoenolpyruvate--protein phosphotransferase [Actinomycetaceae bacterium]|nr:phosphoenolpyruvate--protein phosphotransferase [Actinomycetaceae bacterium]
MTSACFGTPVVPGIGYAPVLWVHRPAPLPQDYSPVPTHDLENEFEHFISAASAVSERLMERALATVGEPSDILIMASALATDPSLKSRVRKLITEQAVPAPHAVDRAIDAYVDQLRLAGGLLAERSTDLIDIKQRIIAELNGEPEPGIPPVDQPSVLFADDLAPADTAGLEPDLIRAIVTVEGGPTSHTSIIARQLGIPCIVAARTLASIPAGTRVLVNGRTGKIEPNPDEKRAQALVTADLQLRHQAQSWEGPAQTADGHRVQLLVNVQDPTGAQAGAQTPAEGIGLFRTELCFLNSSNEPTIDEQSRLYRDVLEAFPDSKVVIRTLDAGSDKPISWLNLVDDDNPALGVRGIRTTGLYADALPHQLDAIAQASEGRDDVWVMAPMVSTIAEARWFADMVRERGLTAGIMVEVPAVAVKARAFLREVDFVSIGTNDLTQYVMAADRTNSHLATYTESWQPAVLALIHATAQAGVETGKPVGVCGEAAADPLLACVLVGMGVSSLSMARSAIGTVGVAIESVTYDQCVAAAQAVLDADDCEQAREFANSHLQLL